MFISYLLYYILFYKNKYKVKKGLITEQYSAVS